MSNEEVRKQKQDFNFMFLCDLVPLWQTINHLHEQTI